jgi:gliding motility-associated-like protein
MMQLQSLKVFKLASSIAFLFLFSLSSLVKAQKADPFQVTKKVPISAEVYRNLKAQGKLNPEATYVISHPVKSGVLSPAKVNKSASRSDTLTSPPCGYVSTVGFQDPWGGEVYFDDSPPAGEFVVPIPFDFCFYGTTYNSFIINNNGNITFDASYTTFTSNAFPDATIPAMIAPFWGDVDTGEPNNPLGQVRYEVYPEYAVVSWDSVAVYNEQANLRNTFQLIISNGTSPVLPAGTNIAFIYGEMQWTTGGASGGTNGFGGTPATVGVNRGDGVDYIQLGRFDAEGTSYDGPFGGNDQVSFLDNTIFFFNTCLQPGALNNIAPIAIGAPLCDTITVCVGSDYALDFNFIPVEPGQTVGAELITTAVPGLTVLPSVPSAQCNVLGTFTGSMSNLGYQTVTFTATDNGTPAASYTIDLTFNVIESTNFPVPVILGDSVICQGASTSLSVSGGPYDSYDWSPNNQITPTLSVNSVDTLTVTVSLNGCTASSLPISIETIAAPQPVIFGEDTICNSISTQLYTSEPFTSYLWSNNSTIDTINVSAGNYTVTVTDSLGCEGSSLPFTITSIQTVFPIIFGEDTVCNTSTTQLFTTEPFSSYQWSNNSTSDSINVSAGNYTVTVIDSIGCSGTSPSFTITSVSAITPVITGDGHTCFDETATISTDSNYVSYVWSGNAGTTNQVTVTDGSYTVSVVDDNGCAGTSNPFVITNSIPTPIIADYVPFCRYDSITLSVQGVGFDSYLWVYGNDTLSLSDSLLWRGGDELKYTVSVFVTDAFGCIGSDTINAPYTNLPTANFTTDPSIITTLSTLIDYNDASTAVANDPLNAWEWVFNSPNSIVSESGQNQTINLGEVDSVNVTLIITSEVGCRDTIYKTIQSPFVPSAFSPNGDDKNQYFKIPFLVNVPGNTVMVFNRWGKKVFEANDYKNDWAGDDLPAGTYYYVVAAPNYTTLKGSVSIFRD